MRGAPGALLYLFAGPGDVDAAALQLEAVDTIGERVKFYPRRPEDDQAKRPSVSGCTFDSGRRGAWHERRGAVPGGGVSGAGPVTVWAQDDKAGVLAAARLARELERRQRPWVIRRPGWKG